MHLLLHYLLRRAIKIITLQEMIQINNIVIYRNCLITVYGAQQLHRQKYFFITMNKTIKLQFT